MSVMKRGMMIAGVCLAMITGLAASRPAAVTAAPAVAPAPVYQLRIYEIFEHNKAAFHARFRDHAMRIMKQYGFTIRSMWESRLDGRTEFVYLLEWPSEAMMKDRWAKFMADEEWTRIKKETAAVHGTLVGEIQDRTLKTLDYSPVLPHGSTPR